MIFDAEDFSRFETCPRLPQLTRVFEPPRWPVRDAVKRFFKMGIRGVMAGESPELTVQAFLAAAASPGFIYPQGENYILAQDHASWLDGALRIVKEENPNLEPLPLYAVGNYQINVEGWTDGEQTHIFRAATNLGGRQIRWPELTAMAFGDAEIRVHNFRLPSVNNGRLSSPLCTAFQHPSFAGIQYRLSRLYDEAEFNKNWKRLGRWEIQPQPDWTEWKLGIERDQCIDKIREVYTVANEMDTAERERLVYDIEMMCHAQEMPSIYPRYRETCQSCIFNRLCHGTADDRHEFKVLGPEEIDRVLKITENIS